MSNKIKRTNDELKADRPTLEEIKDIPRVPISILVENVRSVHNVGSIFRSADGFGAEMIYLTGYTACPPRKDLSKTAPPAITISSLSREILLKFLLSFITIPSNKLSVIKVLEPAPSIKIRSLFFNFFIKFIKSFKLSAL